MSTFNVRVTQVFRVERTTVIAVEADDMDSAVENISSGAVDLPEFGSDAWEESHELQNEHCEPTQ